MDVKSLGVKINMLQAEQSVSNVQLAEKMGKKPQNISKLKKITSPRPETLNKLAKAFDVPVEFFMDYL